MKKFFIVTGVLFSVLFFATGCTSRKEKDRVNEFTQIIRSSTTQVLMNELYMASYDDLDALARMLETSPSVVERLRRGSSEPTSRFRENLNDIMSFYYYNDRSFLKLRHAYDPEFSTWEKIYYASELYPLWYWVLVLGLFIGFATVGFIVSHSFSGGAIAVFICLGIKVLVSLTCWIGILSTRPEPVEDRFMYDVDHSTEQLMPVAPSAGSVIS